jgi:uncharacterized protein (TIGR03000 family)
MAGARSACQINSQIFFIFLPQMNRPGSARDVRKIRHRMRRGRIAAARLLARILGNAGPARPARGGTIMSLTRNRVFLTAAIALCGVLLAAVPAFAAKGGWGGWGGYRGGWGGYNAGWGGYRGGWGGWGGYGPGYYSGVYGSRFGIGIGTAPYYGYGGGYYGPSYDYYTPSYVTTPSSTVIVTPDATTTQSSYYTPAAPDNRAHIEVRVPPDAQVFFDGDQTRQTGSDRMFVSPPLDSGRTYSYNIEARWTEDGRMVDQTRTVKVGAGSSEMVDFSR